MNDHVNESLKAAEAEVAEGRTAPRVTLGDITTAIQGVFYITGNELLEASLEPYTDEQEAITEILTICLCVMDIGFTVIGKAAPMSADNFNRDLGRKLAYEDCVRQLWPLMAYSRKGENAKAIALASKLPVAEAPWTPYVGTKALNATPHTRLEYNNFRNWALPPDENGDDAGYMVQYEDGYISWSPAAQFEAAYKPI